MKTDLTTAIITAIVGVLASYFLLNTVILKEPSPVVVKSLDESTTSATLTEPDPAVFNYRALNPTVETYVDCSNYDASGSCINEGQ